MSNELPKADVETLAKHESCDDEKFWREVKSEANRVHFRLVYRNQMLQAKKDGRKPPTKPAKKPRHGSQQDAFIPSATNVIIDKGHFWDEDQNLEIIEQSRFGSGQKGLATMSVEDANRQSHESSISIEALAILLIGRRFDAYDVPVSMPAMTVRGEPVVIQAALRRLGDRPVTFRAAVEHRGQLSIHSCRAAHLET